VEEAFIFWSTRPIDVPPSRESDWLEDSLTNEQMHTPFGELRASGIL
jgi:hypothetical protein